MDTNELWKDITGYEGLYQVSSLGRIKRLPTKCLAKAGKFRTVRESILTTFPNNSRYGYLYVNLNDYGIKQFRVHRLVALAFIHNPNNLPEVNHIDGDKTNNIVSNLEWCSRLHNMEYSYKIGTHKYRSGNSSPNHKLTKEQVDEIRIKLKNKVRASFLAKTYGVSDAMISLIKHNKYWI